MAETDSASGRERGTTPETFDTPKDPLEKDGQYPNYWARKTRSGHVMMFDDTEENEHILLQHRSGTAIKLLPDGGFEIVSHKGRYDVTFGENRIKVTGAQDTTVDGDVSLKAKKNYNATIYGDSATTVKGNTVETSKSKSTTVAEWHDSVVGWETKKVNNSSTEHVLGAKSLISHYAMLLASTGDSVLVGATTNLGMKSGGASAIETGAEMHINSGADIAVDGPNIWLNSQRSQKASDITSTKKVPPPKIESDYDPGV